MLDSHLFHQSPLLFHKELSIAIKKIRTSIKIQADLHAKCLSLSDFNQNQNISTKFRNISKYIMSRKFMDKGRIVSCGRTDG